MGTKLSQFDQLLKKLKQLAPFEVAEPTIFSIGSKGYYENPTTDILAFFLDDKAAHGLGTLVLEALITSLPKSINDIDCSLSLPPEREVQTQKGKRLDLLLESDEWVMVIENKIYHEKNNPFSEYENFVYKQNSQRFQGKKKFLVILSLDGNIPKELMLWNGISYDSFVHSLKDK
ncbi:PD-(D/E)XK nuclease family protein, partial [Vibrio splendidus]